MKEIVYLKKSSYVLSRSNKNVCRRNRFVKISSNLKLVSNWDSVRLKFFNFFKFLFLFSSPHDGLHSNDIALLKIVRRNDGTAIPFSDFVLPGLRLKIYISFCKSWACSFLTLRFTKCVLKKFTLTLILSYSCLRLGKNKKNTLNIFFKLVLFWIISLPDFVCQLQIYSQHADAHNKVWLIAVLFFNS